MDFKRIYSGFPLSLKMFEMYKLAVGYGDTFLSDTGLLCHLLGIREPEHLTAYPLRGAVFETMVVNEGVKTRMQQGLSSDLTY